MTQRARGQEGFDKPNLDKELMVEDKTECVLITQVRATNVAAGLRRIPVGFYVTVASGNVIQRTSNKPVSVHNNAVEWDDCLAFPFDQSLKISFTLTASFELGPTLGGGEVVREFEFTMAELLDYHGRVELLKSDREVICSPSSFEIKITQQACDQNDYIASSLPLEEEVRLLAEWTDNGHGALNRYRELQERGDLNESIKYFEHARDLCPPGHPSRASVLSNLANAKLIYCRMDDAPDFDMPIDLYRSALHLRPCGHPDHPFTLVSLAIAIAARFQRLRNETDAAESQSLLSQVLGVALSDSYAYHAAVLALGGAADPEVVQSNEIPPVTEDSFHSEGVVQRLDDALVWVFCPCTGEHATLDHLGILFCIRFDSLVDLVDPKRAISMLEVVVQAIFDDHPCKPSWLDDLGYLFLSRYKRSGDVGDLEKSISMLEHAVQITPDAHPDKPLWLDNLGDSLLTRYTQFGNIVDLEKVISVRGDAVQLTPDGNPNKTFWLNNLGNALLARYQRLGNPADLEKSISIFEIMVQFTPDDHPHKPSWLSNFGHSLFSRYEHSGNVSDLESAISIFEGVVQSATDGHLDKASWLNNLGISLSTRYQRFGDPVDLEKSILMLEDAVQSTPNGEIDKPYRLNNLGHLLLTRYHNSGDIADLEKSILLREDAVQSTPDGHPDKSSRKCCLGNSLSARYERFGDIADLKRSITMFEEGVQSTSDDHPNKPLWLTYLGHSLSTRFTQSGNITDLERSLAMFRGAVWLTPDGHPNKPLQLNNLGESFLTRYKHFGDVVDLENAISMVKDAVRLTPKDHPDKLEWLVNLGQALSARFERFGDAVDLEKSISMIEDAVQSTPDGHPDKAARLNALGYSLSSRYEHFGSVVDLEKSTLMFQDAVQSTPDRHLNKTFLLANLSHSLLVRYQRLKDAADLDRSIMIRLDAVKSTPDDHPTKPSKLSNLGHSLLSRFEQSEDAVDLENAISMFADTLQLTSDGHPNKPSRSSNFGHALLTRYKRFGDIADLERSLSFFKDAVQRTPDGHPDKPSRLNSLVRSLLERFRHSGDPQAFPVDLLHAISCSSHATLSNIGPSQDRFQASQLWIKSVRFLHDDSQSLLDAYTAAIDLLPRLAWIGLSPQDRYHQLLQAADDTCDAAAAALEAHEPELAVEWLEQGRSVVWSQFSQLRTPMEDIRGLYPELATQLERVSRRLEHAGARDNAVLDELTEHPNITSGLLEKQAQQYHTLALSRERLLAEIRSLPGLDRFLLPKTIDQLSPLARSGPVVFLNASKHRCDALVLMAHAERVIHVPLSNTSYDEVSRMQSRLNILLRFNGRVISRDNVDRGARPRGTSPEEVFGTVLPYLWNKVVSPILESLALLKPAEHELPRIFWCPTGPFTFLPIHAAGLYDGVTPGSKLSDFVVSSYIPTMSALELPPKDNVKPTSNNIHLLAVSQPNTDGQVQLGGVKRELEVIRELISSSPFVDFQEADGTVEDVLEKMAETNWVHFACHGTQDRTNPLDSGLLLARQKRLKLSDIVQLSRRPGGLAFLSACQTATGDEKLSEEAIHLAAGMLLAGYRGVIATMWSISDSDAPRVAKDVYSSLFRDGEVPDGDRAAEALHYALKRLRESGAPFLSWIPFIHIGS